MNYGYDPTPFDDKLEQELYTWLKAFPDPDTKPRGTVCGFRPYIERDGLYRGVRIRRITDYSAKLQRQLIVEADAIYTRIEKEYNAN